METAETGNPEPMEPGESAIKVDARRFNRNLLILLIVFEVFLVIIDATINYEGWIGVSGIRRMANIAREDGLGTWFMSTQTLLAGLTIFAICLAARGRGASRRVTVSWLVLSLFFIFMAADDAAQIHERLGSAFRYYAEGGGSGSLPGRLLDFFPSYPWQLVLMPVFTALGIFMLVFLWKQLDTNAGRAKLIIAMDCFFLAVFLDFIEGLDEESRLNIFSAIIENTSLGEDAVRHFAKVIEETLEMFGMTLLLSMFFMHLSRTAGIIRLEFLPGVRERA